MNQTTLASIWIQIAKDMTYPDQINTVFLIDDPPDINLDTFGATYQHYLDGVFWSRDWVNSGASRDTLKAQFPALFMEQVTNTAECIEDVELRTTWGFVIIDQLPCDTCPNPSGITVTKLKDKILKLLRQYLKEFTDFEHWNVTIDAEDSTAWISKGRKTYMEGLAGVSFGAFIEDVYSHIVDPGEYTISEWGNMPLIKGYTVNITLEWCDDVSGSFDYSQESAADSGIVTCC